MANEIIIVSPSSSQKLTITREGTPDLYKDEAWFIANPTVILAAAQKAYKGQTGEYKLGNGTSTIAQLSWLGAGGGTGGGAVDSVNGQTGVVVLDATDVGADPSGSAAAALVTANAYTDTGLATKQNALGFTAENHANKDIDGTLTANSDIKYPSQKAVKTYADAVSAAALVSAKAYTDTGLGTKQNALGYTAEDQANKDVDGTLAANSDIKFPSQKAAKTYVDTKAAATLSSANSYTDSGLATKQNSLGYTAENAANKDIDGTLAANSDISYPSQKAVKTYTDAAKAAAIASANSYTDTGLATKQNSLGFTAENVANKDTDGTLAANSDTKYASQKATKTYADTKRPMNPRTTTAATATTLTVNCDTTDCASITALASAITIDTSGTITDFQALIIRLKDNGTPRAITWGASFEAKGTALPTTTVASKVLTVAFLYDSVTSKFGCVGAQQQA